MPPLTMQEEGLTKQRGRKRQLNILLHALGRQVREIAHFLETLKINNPLGLWSWDPLASSYDYGGQNLIHSAYEAR